MVIVPFNINDVVYRADMEENEATPENSVPYIQTLTVAKIMTIERVDGNEIAFSSIEFGQESGPVWYHTDEHRDIPYGYSIETTQPLAEIAAKQFYKNLTGIDFPGVVDVR